MFRIRRRRLFVGAAAVSAVTALWPATTSQAALLVQYGFGPSTTLTALVTTVDPSL